MTPNLETELVHFGLRLAQDYMAQAQADFWRRRAQDFEWAKPVVDDPTSDEHLGDGDLERLREAWRRCHAVATACRAKADFIDWCRNETIQNEIEPENLLKQHSLDMLLWEQRRSGRPNLRLIPGGAA